MINDVVIPPALLMLAGAFLLPFLGKKIRSAAFMFITLGTLLLVWTMPEGSSLTAQVMNYNLVLVKTDALSRIFGIIFAFIAFAGSIYSYHIKETGQHCAALIYAGGALGVTFAGDLFTLFMFWELMAASSVYLIWARRNKAARKAGLRYIIYHVLGGGILFMGILLHFSETGSLAVTRLIEGGGISSWLMLLGVAINAAIPPLHTWLSDAYPKATITGAVFLSAFTTKTAVYVLIRIFPGWEVLLILGAIMTIYGVVFAILANDIRGILAYHIISQVGYMVAGVGIGTEMALNGSAAHAFSHILYKALLFMGAGTVLFSTGKSKLTELGGLHKSMRPALILYMVAAFSISGFPLFNGFISKSMIVSAAGEAHYPLAMFLMLLASVGTFLSVGLKLPYFTWFAGGKKLKPKKLPKNMLAGMGLVAFFCILHGIKPSLLYQLLPFHVHFNPYSVPHLVETVQILAFTFIGFWLYRKKLSPHADIALDIDWFYRRPAKALRKIFVNGTASLFDKTTDWTMALVEKSAEFTRNPVLPFAPDEKDRSYSPDRSRPRMQTIISILLLVFILIVFLGILALG
ncbi:MAG: Na(+)/H(+) antiporter subunit D [Candidatus Aminicenantes bacterium]|nr:Na(+)/H(+) antiporter subunit D [Candidatus Aminicenantes bacterium]